MTNLCLALITYELLPIGDYDDLPVGRPCACIGSKVGIAGVEAAFEVAMGEGEAERRRKTMRTAYFTSLYDIC